MLYTEYEIKHYPCVYFFIQETGRNMGKKKNVKQKVKRNRPPDRLDLLDLGVFPRDSSTIGLCFKTSILK